MEIARMNYYFTGMLIIMLTLLAFCAGPAYPRNEYLNSYPNECRTGEVDVSVSARQYDYDNYDKSWNESNSQDVRLTFRKYLGNLQCNERNDLALENEKLRQQLELMKMCNKVNRNPTLKHNENFNLLVSKCEGVISSSIEEERPVRKNLWKEEKAKYLKENPEAKTMDNTTLKMPPKGYILPLPKPKVDEEAAWNEIE